MNSPIAATTSREGTNHKLVRSTSRRQCEASADDITPRYMAGSRAPELDMADQTSRLTRATHAYYAAPHPPPTRDPAPHPPPTVTPPPTRLTRAPDRDPRPRP